jgi:hypothetical protein
MRKNMIHDGLSFDIICIQIWLLVVSCEMDKEDAVDHSPENETWTSSTSSLLADFLEVWRIWYCFSVADWQIYFLDLRCEFIAYYYS